MHRESIVEPDLPVIDAHHHLAARIPSHHAAMVGYDRFLIDEYLDQVKGGHKVVGSVFMQAATMYRADGPEELRPVGETEFVNGQAAMAASDQVGSFDKVCNLYKTMLQGCSADEKTQIFAGTANRFYRLGLGTAIAESGT